MKKFIAIAAIAIAFASCEEKKAETPVEAPKMDTPAVVAPKMDTPAVVAPKVDSPAVAAPKMEEKKEEVKK